MLVLRELRPAHRRGRLHAPVGLQPRRLPDRRPTLRRDSLNLWDLGPASGLAVEPEAGDLAGWLRRSRALAERGDIAGRRWPPRRRPATSRAAMRPPGSSTPRGSIAAATLQEARDALTRAMEALPDDPGRWIDLGRWLGRIGWTEESATVLAQARSLCERRLSSPPDDEAAAAALAELLPEADDSAGWTVLRPDVMTSAAGATLTRLPDGSVLAGGPNPAVDTYTVEATSRSVRDHRLAARGPPDPSLPGNGPGQGEAPTATSTSTSIRLSTVARSSDPIPVDLTRARADYSDRVDLPGRERGHRRGPDQRTGRSGRASAGPHRAVFQAARPIGPSARHAVARGTGLWSRVWLRITRWAGSACRSRTGRSRSLSRALLTIKADARAERPDAARGGLLSSSATGRRPPPCWPGPRRGPTRRPSTTSCWPWPAITWAGSTRPGAIATAPSGGSRATWPTRRPMTWPSRRSMTIRGLGVDGAEAFLLDVAFPADPFAR